MPGLTKPYDCVLCHTSDFSSFRGTDKSLCKQCAKHRSSFTHELTLKKFYCEVCRTEDEEKFYRRNKSKCKQCISQYKKDLKDQSRTKPKIVIIRKESEPELEMLLEEPETVPEIKKNPTRTWNVIGSSGRMTVRV